MSSQGSNSPNETYSEEIEDDRAQNPEDFHPLWLNLQRRFMNEEDSSDDEYNHSQNPHNRIVPFHRTSQTIWFRRPRLEERNVDPRLEEPFIEQGRFNIAGYFDSLIDMIGVDIRIPRDSRALRKRISVLCHHCENSPANTSLLHSVNVYGRLMGALSLDFDMGGIRNSQGVDESRANLKLCREIVKLVEILGFHTDRPFPIFYQIFCGIVHVLYFGGGYSSDRASIVRILHAMLYDVEMPYFQDHYRFIRHYLEDPTSRSRELSLCVDVTSLFLVRRYDDPLCTYCPLSKALSTIVSRMYDLSRCSDWADQQFREESTVLEKIMKLLCRFCVKYGELTVSGLRNFESGVMGQVTKILSHALLHRRPGAKTFNGRHLLYALLLAKYIYECPGWNYNARPEDVKMVLDFSMSDLPNRYLFNGSRKLKDLVDQMVPGVLKSFVADSVLINWNTMPGVHSNLG